jgi:hypothetical protein
LISRLTKPSNIKVWEKRDPAVEIAQGKAIADAAVSAGASLLIFSSLPHIGRMTNGEFTLPHWETKADVETYIRGLPIASVFYVAGYYMQNFNHPYFPKQKIVRRHCFLVVDSIQG